MTRVDGGFEVVPPSWRPDLTGRAELAEEVARLAGYHRIPSVLPVAPPGRGLTRSQRIRRRVADTLAAAGSTEVLSFPFATEAENAMFGSADGAPVASVRLANALDASAALLRRSLCPGSSPRRSATARAGSWTCRSSSSAACSCPRPDRTYGSARAPGRRRATERRGPRDAAGGHPAAAAPRRRAHRRRRRDEAARPGARRRGHRRRARRRSAQVALAVGAEIEVAQGSHQALHPGRTAELRVAGRPVGFAGELLPALAEEADLPRVVAVVELDLDAVIELTEPGLEAGQIGTYPAATQDLSLLVATDVPAVRRGRRRARRRGGAPRAPRARRRLPRPGRARGSKSLTFALRFRAEDRTLTAAEASEAKLAGAAVAAERTGAAIRE